jgi:hypothetical protein
MRKSRKPKITLAEANEALTIQWHPTKNGNLTPDDLAPNSHKKVWWLLPYDDSKTGKHWDMEWEATVSSRHRGLGCPYLTGHKILIGFNDLATLRPDLAAQWHPTKNGTLKPSDVTENSGKMVWWFLPYDDPETGHHDFEWPATIYSRSSGMGCPYLSGQAIWQGYNDLLTKCPDIAAQWHQTKNGTLKPSDVAPHSNKKVWWMCEKGHEWLTTVYNRCSEATGCPQCSKELRTSYPEQVIYYYINKLFPDASNGDKTTISLELDIYIPSISVAIEYDGNRWHKDINRDLQKNDECKKSGIRLIRVREVGCPQLNDCSCEIIDVICGNKKSLCDAINTIATRLNHCIDVDIDRDETEIRSLIEYTKKKNSLANLFPDIAAQWHRTKNGNLTPDCVAAKSGLVVWWLLSYDDPRSGKHFDIPWQAAICDRTIQGNGCPALSGNMVVPGFNDLSTLNPELAIQWDCEKNKGLVNKRGEDISTPDKVTPGSHQKVWWKCSKCGHEWLAKVENRHRLNQGCPECYKNSRKRKTISQSDLDLSSDEKSA